jgi:hypothetical protein
VPDRVTPTQIAHIFAGAIRAGEASPRRYGEKFKSYGSWGGIAGAENGAADRACGCCAAGRSAEMRIAIAKLLGTRARGDRGAFGRFRERGLRIFATFAGLVDLDGAFEVGAVFDHDAGGG